MAKRLSVKEILEAARKGGPAKPAEASSSAPEVEEAAVERAAEVETARAEAEADAAEPAEAEAPAVAANVPTPSSLGRPLTLKEKLAAARAGGAAKPAAAAPAAPAKPPAPAKAAAPAARAEEAAEAAAAEAPKAVPAPAKPLGRPMTLQEQLAAARSGGASAPAAPAGAAKPAAAKPAPAATAAAARTLPPLEKMTDPRDLAEAARQAAAKKAKELAAKAAEAAPAKARPAPAKPAPAKPAAAPPKPGRELAAAAAAGPETSRRGFFLGGLFIPWIIAWLVVAWSTFTAALSAMTLMSVRFMFPNVLAEPPSTIKIGLPSNYEPEKVSERYKADYGFWVVRSTRYKGQDILYALQSVCTHLGCPPNWLESEQKFKCPCHGSGFYISGINFEGPAPRPLERFKVAFADDGQIMVDKSQKFQEELGQWTDPDSFVVPA
jgi:cytochrome b6-f complex iron-sulfur subunit